MSRKCIGHFTTYQPKHNLTYLSTHAPTYQRNFNLADMLTHPPTIVANLEWPKCF
jgi:hypothetical protein